MAEETFNLSDLIDEYLGRESRPARIGTYWPSEIGHCTRMNYYKRFIPTKIPSEKLRVFKSADLAHSFAREVLASSDRVRLLTWEKSFSILHDDFEISGRLDDMILVKIAGKDVPIVIEVKSISGKSVGHIRSPSVSHLYQIHPYLRAVRSSVGIVWYIARDTYADRSFSIFYDKEVMSEVLLRVKRLHLRLVNRELPEPEAKTRKDLLPCWFCPFWRECRADFNPAKTGPTPQSSVG